MTVDGAGGAGNSDAGGGAPRRRRFWHSQVVIGWIGVLVASLALLASLPFWAPDRGDDDPSPRGTETSDGAEPVTPPTSDAVSSAPVPEPVVESSTSGPTTSPPQGDPPSGMNALDRYMTDVYHLEVPSLHYVDIDGQAISATPNRNHEFLYYSGWLQTSSPISDQGTAFVEMGVINDSDVPQCAARSQRQEGILHFGMMQTTQSVCVRTSEGRWALVQVESADEQLGGGVLLHIGYLRDQ